MSFFDALAGGGSLPGPVPTPEALCSRKGCRTAADWKILWNNPRVHTPDRRKAWLACGEHREWLEEYLRLRGFWKETVPFEETAAGHDVPSVLHADPEQEG